MSGTKNQTSIKNTTRRRKCFVECKRQPGKCIGHMVEKWIGCGYGCMLAKKCEDCKWHGDIPAV